MLRALPSPVYVMSDAHLGFATRDVERSLIAFLRYLPGRAGGLVINGDLFEFWFEWKRVIPRASFRVLAALADLRDAGVPILMIAGNHDCWGGEILTKDVGLDYQFGPWDGDLAGWTARIDHGDGLRDKEDQRYRLLRSVFRNRLAIWAFRWLHPDVGAWVAADWSDTSRTYQARDGGAGLRQVAEEQLKATGSPELLIFGHSHVAALERAGTGVYANAGAWLHKPTFLRLTSERIELCSWNGTGGDVVTTVNRER